MYPLLGLSVGQTLMICISWLVPSKPPHTLCLCPYGVELMWTIVVLMSSKAFSPGITRDAACIPNGRAQATNMSHSSQPRAVALSGPCESSGLREADALGDAPAMSPDTIQFNYCIVLGYTMG
jgi:hypothetical protein